MPASRITLGLVAPVLGAVAGVMLGLAAGDHMSLRSFLAPVVGAWLVMALGAWLKVQFEERRPARVAVIGSAGFASDLAAVELEAAKIRGYEVIGWFGAAAPAVHSGGLECLGALDGVRAAVVTRKVELLVWAREETDEQRGRAGPRGGYRSPRAARRRMPGTAGEADRGEPALRGAARHVPLGTIDSAWYRYIMHPRFRPTAPLWKRCSDLALEEDPN